jgi:hypothetical protein
LAIKKTGSLAKTVVCLGDSQSTQSKGCLECDKGPQSQSASQGVEYRNTASVSSEVKNEFALLPLEDLLY